jgi:hypothetical protein
MTVPIDPDDIVTFSLQLNRTLREYTDRKTWTPVEGAMLLAGLRPPEDCRELPTTGGTGLDGTTYTHSANDPFSEARRTLYDWRVWCDDWIERVEEDGRAALCDDDPFVIPDGQPLAIPDQLDPFRFINWFLEFQVRERGAVLYEYRWVPAFKELIGYPAENPYVPVGLALYAQKLSQPVEIFLAALNASQRSTLDAISESKTEVISRIPTRNDGEALSDETWDEITLDKGLPKDRIVACFSRNENGRIRLQETFSKPPYGLKKQARISAAQGVMAHWNPVAVALWLLDHRGTDFPKTVLDDLFSRECLRPWRTRWTVVFRAVHGHGI